MDKETAIRSLKAKLDELELVHNSSEYYNWNSSTVSKLEIICPKNSIVKSVSDINAVGWKSDNTPSAKARAKTLLTGLIQDIEDFGLERMSADAGQKEYNPVNVSVNQQNTQNQSTEVSINFEYIIEVLKGELRNSEIDELKDILEADVEPKQKKKNFVEKIKSFGSDVASNILANILTNPQVYEQLGGML